jgi:hypothetical protein
VTSGKVRLRPTVRPGFGRCRAQQHIPYLSGGQQWCICLANVPLTFVLVVVVA